MFLNRVIIGLILLVSTGFFGVKYLSLSQIRLFQLFAAAIMIASVIISIYGNSKNTINKKFIAPIVIIMIGVFLSTLIAKAYHNQPIWLTFWAQAPMYWYIFYFFLHSNKFQKKDLENAILFFAVLYSIFLIIQTLILPTILFDVRIDNDPSRSTIRIFLPGFAFLVVGYFLALNKFFVSNKWLFLGLGLWFFAIVVMQGTRQYMFSFMLVTLYAIFFSKKVNSRGLIILLIALSAIPIFFLFKDIFISMIELTTAAVQGQDVSANARERAYLFFLTDFFPSKIAYVFGNGMDHMRSEYGLRVALLKRFALYQTDIGIFGEYTVYGVIFVSGALLSLIKLMKEKFAPSLYYIRYYAIFIIILLPLRGSFTSPDNISILCILFYLTDRALIDDPL